MSFQGYYHSSLSKLYFNNSDSRKMLEKNFIKKMNLTRNECNKVATAMSYADQVSTAYHSTSLSVPYLYLYPKL